MSKWNETLPVRAYELIRSGLSEAQTAGALGVTTSTFKRWKLDKPAFSDALDRAKRSILGDNENSFKEYVFNRLPPHLRELWEKINLCERVHNGVRRAEALLVQAGKQARQHLFLYALVNSNFNPSEACKSVNISKNTLDRWVLEDPDFAELVDEIHWHKANYFEGALFKLVEEGEPSVIIFANRTFNRTRGYSDKVEVSIRSKVGVRGEITHSHEVKVGVDELGLPLDTRRQILEALRRRREQGPGAPARVEVLEPTSNLPKPLLSKELEEVLREETGEHRDEETDPRHGRNGHVPPL